VGFLFASFLLHAFGFYLFQIVYPPAIALLPPPGRVTIIAPNTTEGRVLLRWVEAEDPALASTTQPPEQATLSLPTVQHAPSYLTHQPTLKEMPQLSQDVGIPSVHPPGPIEPVRGQLHVTRRISPTAVRFSTELETLGPAQIPKMTFTASGHDAPSPGQFRIAVSSKGDIRFCFPETSSGDTALDEQARRYLMHSRFEESRPPSGDSAELVWGTATIDWGNDIVVPPMKTTENVTP